MNIEQEIANLKLQITDLRQHVTKLEHKLYPQRPAEPERQVTITPTRDVNLHFIAPSSEELVELHRISQSLHPRVATTKGGDLATTLTGFAAAFEYLGNVGRSASINDRRGLLEWVQDAGAWCRSHGRHSHISGPDFCLAAASHFDIACSLESYPSVGFSISRNAAENPATNAWKKLLEKHRAAELA